MEPDYQHELFADVHPKDEEELPGPDDPEYEEAYKWNCCSRSGRAPGALLLNIPQHQLTSST